jgi:hypothetical protein
MGGLGVGFSAGYLGHRIRIEVKIKILSFHTAVVFNSRLDENLSCVARLPHLTQLP